MLPVTMDSFSSLPLTHSRPPSSRLRFSMIRQSMTDTLMRAWLRFFPRQNMTRRFDAIRFVGGAAVVGLLISFSVSASAQSPASELQPAARSQPNFIVVYCDNLGYGDIEPFGSTLHRTPNLNRMAAEGRKFTHFCVTAGVCTPSRASLMTGCYPQRVGMHHNDRDGWVLRPVSPYGLHPDEVTIAEVLKQQGYATAIVGKWHLGDQPSFLPTRQGFDWFFGVPYSDDMTARVWQADGSTWPPLPLMENERVIEAPCDRNGLTKRYTERAMQWIAEHKDEPFFLYFPQAMPGSTRTPFSSPDFKGKSNNGPWGDSIEELDWSIGVMLDQLEELGIADNTLVIWTSDNGAPINPDPDDLSRGSNLPLHGRGYTTSEGAFRVPTIAWQPGKVPAGTVCSELATTMDLLPTCRSPRSHGPQNRRPRHPAAVVRCPWCQDALRSFLLLPPGPVARGTQRSLETFFGNRGLLQPSPLRQAPATAGSVVSSRR